jgi:hypothetical protein
MLLVYTALFTVSEHFNFFVICDSNVPSKINF